MTYLAPAVRPLVDRNLIFLQHSSCSDAHAELAFCHLDLWCKRIGARLACLGCLKVGNKVTMLPAA